MAMADARRAEIENAVGASIASSSWLASDIAPVGVMAEARLAFKPVAAQVWVVLAMKTRLERCDTTGGLLQAVVAAGCEVHVLIVDSPKSNLRRIDTALGARGGAAAEGPATKRPADRAVPEVRGGLFRAQLSQGVANGAVGP
jgi:hypothetical protein